MRNVSDFLKLNGKNMPTPDENVTYAKEPLWSSNAGRTSSGLFVGDITAEKQTAEFTFTGLTSEEIAMIEAELTTFYTVSFPNPLNPSERVEFECYRPPRSFPLKRMVNGVGKFDSFSLSCIER